MNLFDVLLAAALGKNGRASASDFSTIQRYLRAGLISRLLEVGDQIKVNKESSLSVTLSATGITAATVNEDSFLAAVGTAGTAAYEFKYDGAAWQMEGQDGSWHAVELSAYGIQVTGTPAADDIIVVHEQASEIVFDVVGIDYDVPANSRYAHSLSLLTRDVQTYGTIMFSQPQALKAIAADEFPTGLAAGSYYFTLDHGCYDGTDKQDGIYGFVLTQPVPVGGKIKHTTIGKYQSSYTKDQITAGTFTTYDASFNVIESGIATTLLETATGTNLGTCTAETMSYMVGSHLNSTRRQAMGSAYAAASANYKWLNSKAAGAASGQIASWWTPSDEFDMPVKSTLPGFLHGMDPGFVSCLGKVLKRTFMSAWDNGGTAGYKDTEDLVWLPSMTEVGFGNNSTVLETSPNADGTITNTGAYPYYTDAVNADRIKYYTSTARYWWLRSPYPSLCNDERLVSPSGALNHSSASSTSGVVAGLCII